MNEAININESIGNSTERIREVVIGYINKSVTYANTTSFLIGYLPPNAYIVDIPVLQTTDFTDGVLDIGTSASAARYVNDQSLNASAGKQTVTSTAYWGVVESTTEPTGVYGIVVATGTGLSAGALKVVVSYAFNE